MSHDSLAASQVVRPTNCRYSSMTVSPHDGHALQGQQAAVRIAASYDAALILTLILCYYLETRLYTRQSTAPTATDAKLSTQRLSGPRIISRHVGVIALLLLLVVVRALQGGIYTCM